MTASVCVLEDLRYREHRGPEGHPESPDRLHAVSQAISRFAEQLEVVPPRPAENEEILRVHGADYLRELEQAVASAPGRLDPDTYVSEASLEVARLAAGGAIELARRVARGEARSGLAAVRPPGHHAETGHAMGFCLLNNVAIAARALQVEDRVERILILDWDVHHGNGTQHFFEDDPSVLYLSTHQFPYYPGTGDVREAGTGRGVGTTVNVPMPAGCGDAEYVGSLQRVLVPVAREFAPDMILVSCGFDAHRDDPLASMQLSGDGFLAMTRLVRTVARELCQDRTAFILEGGYAPSGLSEGTSALFEGLLEAEPPALTEAPPASPGSLLKLILDPVIAVHGDRYARLGTV